MAIQRVKRASRLNIVNVTVVLILLGLGYGAVMFGPAYWRKWKVKEALDEVAHEAYRRRAQLMLYADKRLTLELKAKEMVKKVGIEDADLRVELRVDRSQVTIWADYRETIQHPVANKRTVLHFRPAQTLEIKNE